VSGASRTKGRSGELEVARIFRDAGYDCERVPNSGGLRIKGDLYGNVPAHIEVKRTERLELWRALKQAEDECGSKPPVLVFRRNRSPWYAAVPLDYLLSIMAASRALSGAYSASQVGPEGGE
jgi:hypothetical protein